MFYNYYVPGPEWHRMNSLLQSTSEVQYSERESLDFSIYLTFLSVVLFICLYVCCLFGCCCCYVLLGFF